MNKVLLISFDAVGSDELPVLREKPNFGRLIEKGTLFPDLCTTFVSNTYPIHTSIVTGVTPDKHGLFSNTMVQPEKAQPDWCYDSRLIQVETLWQAAAKKGLRTAAVMWPVTAYAKEIRWNIPEIMKRPGENQVLVNLRTGSKWLQIKEILRHRNLLNGSQQPERDRFATACMCDIIREKRPDMMLMHLTAYDSLCHENGRGSDAALSALDELDANLGKLVEAVDDETLVLVFSDHAQLNVHTAIDANLLLSEMGLLELHTDGTVSKAVCFFQNVEGSAFFFRGTCTDEVLSEIRQRIVEMEGVERLLTDSELYESGYHTAAFGICASPGYYLSCGHPLKASHGYPTDYKNYRVFIAVSQTGWDIIADNLLEVTRVVRKALSL